MYRSIGHIDLSFSVVLLLFGRLSIAYGTPALADTLAPSGTLVVMVPSKDGLVMAADSRSSIGDTYCDYAFKIIEPVRPARTAVTVTGNGVMVKRPGPDVSDLCEYVRRAPRLLDIERVVSEYLASENTDIATLQIENVAQRCVAAVKDFQASWPLALRSFEDREVFSVVLASYEVQSRMAVIRSFVLRLIGTTLNPEFGKVTADKFFLNSKRAIRIFGETGYLEQYVSGGIGRQFLSEETIRFEAQERIVREIDLREAIAVAVNVIEATSKTTNLIPAPSGIGGPIDVGLLGEAPQLEKLQWKKSP